MELKACIGVVVVGGQAPHPPRHAKGGGYLVRTCTVQQLSLRIQDARADCPLPIEYLIFARYQAIVLEVYGSWKVGAA